MALTNEELAMAVEEYGDGIWYIQLNNNYKLYFGYKSGHIKSVKEIQYKTFGEADFFGFEIPVADPYAARKGVTTISWHLTELIECIGVMGEGFENFRGDPFTTG